MIMRNQENIVDTLASAESFTTDFTAIGAVICVTLSMDFKICLSELSKDIRDIWRFGFYRHALADSANSV